MPSVLTFWQENRDFLREKGVQQMIALCGDGRLRDHTATSKEFRDLLSAVPSDLLARYADECLTPFENSGFALQDIINEIGARLGFEVNHGLYRGRPNELGSDGIWRGYDNTHLVVEVKTSDTYRINLDTVAGYRDTLAKRVQHAVPASILIVVGRQDTGDLEAQIRGSRHAWDIRLISVDGLLKLLAVKENLTDSRTAQQISEVLKPLEYTRVDRLIEIIFSTSEDFQLEAAPGHGADAEADMSDATLRNSPSSFHSECIERIAKHLGMLFIRDGRNRYTTQDKKVRLVCAVSKEYPKSNHTEYWFSFHPAQREYLREKTSSLVAYGCGSPDKIILFEFDAFDPVVEEMWTTSNEQRHYWHVFIHESGSRFFLALGGGKRLDITSLQI